MVVRPSPVIAPATSGRMSCFILNLISSGCYRKGEAIRIKTGGRAAGKRAKPQNGKKPAGKGE
ncbi:hypothetical protein F2Q69_00003687 [Brassica cretica]|uniref:Uncharacterized protein n=1 Tax=Brassica cretica TaxID=69181 RepID=A0A8S9P5S0_BRACR|nr:hypothetical protein F2Q69_00003687 [Brassica cretica]